MGKTKGSVMSECKGFFGKIFGHKFESILMEKNFNHSLENFIPYGINAMEMLDGLAQKKYKVVCKRCGEEPSGVAKTEEIREG